MKSFTLKPASTGSTTKSHKSQSLSISSSTGSSSYSTATSVVSSSLAHAKHATGAAWSACKQGTRATLKKGSSAFKSSGDRKSHAPPSPSLSWNQGQSRVYTPSRRVRRLFRFGGGSGGGGVASSLNRKSRYQSLGEDIDTDDDDRDIFSGRPFSERVDVHSKDEFSHGHDHHSFCDHDNDDNDRIAAQFVFTPRHAAASYLATSTARHMQFAADEGEGDDDEWWRD